MHEGIDVLEATLPTAHPADVYAVTHQALASAISVIARADDVDAFMAELRGTHRRRPRCTRNFDRARLP